MLLCIIMVIMTVVFGAGIYYIGSLFKTKLDVDNKCKDFVSWYTKEAQADVAKFVAEKRGELIRKRILINAFKSNTDYKAFAKIKDLTPPAFICANLPDSYLNSALSLAA